MRALLQDLPFGARMLWKNPGFTLIVLLTLSLGIGANTAIFSVVNAVMLRQLPFKNADRLVRLRESNPERGWPSYSVSHPNFLDWRARNQTFEAMAATADASFNLNTGDDTDNGANFRLGVLIYWTERQNHFTGVEELCGTRN
jgi:putative ABC transport system permease protein